MPVMKPGGSERVKLMIALRVVRTAASGACLVSGIAACSPIARPELSPSAAGRFACWYIVRSTIAPEAAARQYADAITAQGLSASTINRDGTIYVRGGPSSFDGGPPGALFDVLMTANRQGDSTRVRFEAGSVLGPTAVAREDSLAARGVTLRLCDLNPLR